MKYYVIKTKDKKYVKDLNFGGEIILTDKQKEAKRFEYKILAEEYLLDFKHRLTPLNVDLNDVNPTEKLKKIQTFKIFTIKSKKLNDVEAYLESQTKKLTKEEKQNYLKELQPLLKRRELKEELKALDSNYSYDSYYKESEVAERMYKILLKQELMSNKNVREYFNSIDEAIKNIPGLVNALDLILNKNNQDSSILKEYLDDLIKNQKIINNFKEDSKIKRVNKSKLQELITKTKNGYKIEDLKELFKEVVKKEDNK